MSHPKQSRVVVLNPCNYYHNKTFFFCIATKNRKTHMHTTQLKHRLHKTICALIIWVTYLEFFCFISRHSNGDWDSQFDSCPISMLLEFANCCLRMFFVTAFLNIASLQLHKSWTLLSVICFWINVICYRIQSVRTPKEAHYSGWGNVTFPRSRKR